MTLGHGLGLSLKNRQDSKRQREWEGNPGHMTISIVTFHIITNNRYHNICFLQGILVGTVGDTNRHKCLSMKDL